MTDAEFLLAVLSDRKPHALHEIILASVRERGHAFTVHSRAADLRRLGYTITNTPLPPRGSVYQLVAKPLDETATSPCAVSLSGGGEGASSKAKDGEVEAPSPLQMALDVPRQEAEVGGRRAARVKTLHERSAA